MIRWLALSVVILAIQLQVSATWASPLFQNLESAQPESIEDHQVTGKWLIVMLWASDCPACNKEASEYVDFHLRHREHDATMLGISLDGQARINEAKDFVQRHEVVFSNLLAEWDSLADYYEQLTQTPWIGTPSFLVFGPDGNLEAKQTGAVPVDIIEMFLDQYGS